MGSLTQCPITFVFLNRSLPDFLFVCRRNNRLLYIGKKTVWKQTSCHLWKGDFDCINLTVKFRYWSCGNVHCNWKNLIAVLKELNCTRRLTEHTCIIWMTIYIVITTISWSNLALNIPSPAQGHSRNQPEDHAKKDRQYHSWRCYKKVDSIWPVPLIPGWHQLTDPVSIMDQN